MTCDWMWFRYDLGGSDAVKNTIRVFAQSSFVQGFVIALLGGRVVSLVRFVRHYAPRRGIRTQFLLKQSWEQKKLSNMPNFKHVGHCRELASFSQSVPMHFSLASGSAVADMIGR